MSELLDEQQVVHLSDPTRCAVCKKYILTLAIGSRVWPVERVDAPVFATDAYGDILKVGPDLAPFYIVHHEPKQE